MATFLELYQRQYADPELTQRVQVAITQNARYILTQEKGGGHPNEANRQAWAAAAIVNPARTLALIMVWVVVHPEVVDKAEITDQAINQAVGEAIDPIANAFKP